MQRRRAGCPGGKMPKAQPELVIKDSKLALNSKAEEDLPPAGIVDGEKSHEESLGD